VLHYAGLSRSVRRGPVVQVHLYEFANGQADHIECGSEPALDPQEIVARAQSRLGGSRYRLLTNNCEHFSGVGLDRDRAFYTTVTIVVASYHVLFAAMGGSGHTLILELIVMSGFVTAAVLGFRKSEWILVAALAGHGVFDALRGNAIENPGVPAWRPAFCGTYDVVAAACLGWILVHRSGAAAKPDHPA
jgi:Lecithin retinol acyltransferase